MSATPSRDKIVDAATSTDAYQYAYRKPNKSYQEAIIYSRVTTQAIKYRIDASPDGVTYDIALKAETAIAVNGTSNDRLTERYQFLRFGFASNAAGVHGVMNAWVIWKS